MRITTPVSFVLLLVAALGSAQPVCHPVEFQTTSFGSFSTNWQHIVVRQSDGSYTLYELQSTSPYTLLQTVPYVQQQFASCHGTPATPAYGETPGTFTRLPSGGYLWFRQFYPTTPAQNTALVATEFDSSLKLVSEHSYPVVAILQTVFADVNGDGIPDILAVTQYAQNTSLDVWIGLGGSAYLPPVNHVLPNSLGVKARFPSATISALDLNGDGKVDVAVAYTEVTGSGNGLFVFSGNGTGSFGSPRVFLAGMNPTNAAFADVNEDGIPDVVFISGTSIGFAAGDGTGSFGPTVPIGPAYSSFAIADMDGDGHLDIVGANGTMRVFFGDGTGAFPRRSKEYLLNAYPHVVITDFNGDGLPDVVLASGDANIVTGSQVEVLFNSGGGVFAGAPFVAVPFPDLTFEYPYDLLAADFNQDGNPDLVELQLTRLAILQGNGDGSFAPPVFLGTGSTVIDPVGIAVADMNNDGRPDLVAVTLTFQNPPIFGPSIPNYQTQVYLAGPDGTLSKQPATQWIAGNQLNDNNVVLATGDFNADGNTDAAVLAASKLLIYLGDGAGGLAQAIAYSVGANPVAIAIGDFNGDGIQDVAIAGGDGTPTGNGNLRILLGTGDGAFAVPTAAAPLALPPFSMVAADFNGDGILELAIAQYGGPVQILIGQGDGTFSAALPKITLRVGSKLIVADLNGDSIPDLVTQTNGSIYLLGNGDGTFQPQVAFANGAILAVADLDGDGAPDIAAATSAGVVGFLNLGTQPTPRPKK